MTPEERNRWLPVLLIAGALAAWGVLLAVGAWMVPSDPGAARDFRKLWVVAAMVGAFLLLWGGALWSRGRRLRREDQKDSDSGGGQIPRRTSYENDE
jgi:hypothetical protein